MSKHHSLAKGFALAIFAIVVVTITMGNALGSNVVNVRATSAPSHAPTTSKPSKAPSTSAPTKAPSTSTPTKNPTKQPTTLAPTAAPVCFHSSTSYVELIGGQTTLISNLKYGDEILISPDGQYSKIIAFTGYFPEQVGVGLNINRGQLILSPNHLIHLTDLGEFRKASELKLGSNITVDNKLVTVNTLELGNYKGWITPLTETSTLMVNNVLVSSHTEGPHEVVSKFYEPYKLYLKYFPWKSGTKPTENDGFFYSLWVRRSVIGQLILGAMIGASSS